MEFVIITYLISRELITLLWNESAVFQIQCSFKIEIGNTFKLNDKSE